MTWLPWGSVILGIWLIVAPFVFGYSMVTTQVFSPMWNDIIVGVLSVAFGLFSWFSLTRPAASR